MRVETVREKFPVVRRWRRKEADVRGQKRGWNQPDPGALAVHQLLRELRGPNLEAAAERQQDGTCGLGDP